MEDYWLGFQLALEHFEDQLSFEDSVLQMIHADKQRKHYPQTREALFARSEFLQIDLNLIL